MSFFRTVLVACTFVFVMGNQTVADHLVTTGLDSNETQMLLCPGPVNLRVKACLSG